MTNDDRRLDGHPILGAELVYRADLPPYDRKADEVAGGVLVIGNGMTVTVLAAFHTWNGVEGLDMLFVACHDTGLRTHVTPRDLGWTEPLRPA